MNCIYCKLSDEQIKITEKIMHNSIHKLLLYKDPNFTKEIFCSDNEFKRFFEDLLFKFGGMNEVLGYPNDMLILLSTLQAAYKTIDESDYDYKLFRKAILDSHGYLKRIFTEVK